VANSPPLAKRPHYAVTLDLKSLPLDSFATLLQDQVQRLSGQLSYEGTLAYRQDSDGYSIHQEGSTRVQLLDAAVRQPPINAHNDDARLDSKLSFSSAAGEPTLQLSSDIRLSGLNVVAGDSRLELLRSARLDLSGLAMQGMDRLSIQSVAAEKLVIGRQADDTEQDASMDVDRFEVTSLALADKLLSVDEVNYTGGHNHLRRDPEGNWRIIAIVKAMSRLAAKQEDAEVAPAPREGTDNTAEAPQPLAAVVKRIKVDGDSTISLLDQSVKPAFQVNVKLNSVLIESLDTRQPEQKSPVQIDASVGKYTRLSLQGDVQPFATPLGMDLKANIDALDLPPLSPYTRESLGLVLDSGTLDADATVKIDKKKMDGLVKLKLHQLELENVESKNSLQSQIPVPLDVALDTLRDSNNTISLKVPVTGDPANPDFDVNDVLSKALAGGVKKGALTYLTLALQPYGTLITAAKYAGEEITKVRLNPVEFEPGQAGLNDTDKDYLSKVAKVLNERPQLAIKLCGVAVPRDTAWFRQQAAAAQKSGDKTGTATRPAAPEVADTQLLDLARARAESVKDYLVTTFKIPADHLVGCRPRIETDADKGAAPRTDLLI
jgi:outer membrane protein OmpA-like peptidoglycan-associated protein